MNMTMNAKNWKPAVGSTLTLALDYWDGENKKGAKVKVVEARKDKRCSSGLRVTVEMKGAKHKQGLDARWFAEFGHDFIFGQAAPVAAPLPRRAEDITNYKSFIIKPKRDFGPHGHLVDGKVVKTGFNVCHGPKHEYAGCNAMPGGTWFESIKEAKHAIDILLKVKGDAERFWEVMQPFGYKLGMKMVYASGSVECGRFTATVENFLVVKMTIRNRNGTVTTRWLGQEVAL